jgi:hypothetical protein
MTALFALAFVLIVFGCAIGIASGYPLLGLLGAVGGVGIIIYLLGDDV